MSGILKPGSGASADDFMSLILPLRERAEVKNSWLKHRLEKLLPKLMDREGFDMWIVIAREYNEDPVIMSLLPEPQMAARRRTILVFNRTDEGLECLTVSRYDLKDFYKSVWDPEEMEDQYQCLAELVEKRDPEGIGINVSHTFKFADGLTHGEYQLLEDALGPELMDRTGNAEGLCVGWLEHRTERELDAYPSMVEITHAIIAEAFSSRVIQPGVTETDDVVWWMRQKIRDLGLRAWFQPSVDIQAPGQRYDDDEKRTLILPGDLLHCDIGFYYLGLATDVQQNAYVLRPGEVDAPWGLKAALKDANRLQDLHAENMVEGRTGNEILQATREQAEEEGIVPSVYTHPIGYHGHAAGPTIGLWDMQEGVPGRGDYPLYNNTCYAIELNAKKTVPGWGDQEVRMALEQDAAFIDDRLYFMAGRQTKLHLI